MNHNDPQNTNLTGSTVVSSPSRGDRLIYFGMFLFLSIIIALLTYLTSQGFGNGWHITAGQIGAFIALGLLNVVYLQRRKQYPEGGRRVEGWWQSVAGGAAIIVTLFIIAVFTGVHNWLLILASAASFLLPATIFEAWKTYCQVPGVSSLPWKAYSIEGEENFQNYKKDIEVSFKIQDQSDSKRATRSMLSGKVSRYTKVGAGFFELTSELNHPGGEADNPGLQHAAMTLTFYVRDLVLGKRWLNPELSFHQNRVGPKSIIIVQRINDTDL